MQTEAPPLGVARFFFLQAAAWPRCARFQRPSTRSNRYSGCMASCPIFLGPVGSFFFVCVGTAEGFVALRAVRWRGPSLYYMLPWFFKVFRRKAGKINRWAPPHEGSKALCIGKGDCLADFGCQFLQLAGVFQIM